MPEPPFIIFAYMDHQFTKQIQAWLNAKHESDADVIKGANMLFRLNRDRFYHARATRQPQAYRSNIEYELGKFLKIRLDKMTIDEVKQMDSLVIPEAQAIIDHAHAYVRQFWDAEREEMIQVMVMEKYLRTSGQM